MPALQCILLAYVRLCGVVSSVSRLITQYSARVGPYLRDGLGVEWHVVVSIIILYSIRYQGMDGQQPGLNTFGSELRSSSSSSSRRTNYLVPRNPIGNDRCPCLSGGGGGGCLERMDWLRYMYIYLGIYIYM